MKGQVIRATFSFQLVAQVFERNVARITCENNLQLIAQQFSMAVCDFLLPLLPPPRATNFHVVGPKERDENLINWPSNNWALKITSVIRQIYFKFRFYGIIDARDLETTLCDWSDLFQICFLLWQ